MVARRRIALGLNLPATFAALWFGGNFTFKPSRRRRRQRGAAARDTTVSRMSSVGLCRGPSSLLASLPPPSLTHTLPPSPRVDVQVTEVSAPAAYEFASAAEVSTFTRSQLLLAERALLRELDYYLYHPTSSSFSSAYLSVTLNP